jgi:hypothetical protein
LLLGHRSERAALPVGTGAAGAEIVGHRRGAVSKEEEKREEGGAKMLACLVLWAPAMEEEEF